MQESYGSCLCEVHPSKWFPSLAKSAETAEDMELILSPSHLFLREKNNKNLRNQLSINEISAGSVTVVKQAR